MRACKLNLMTKLLLGLLVTIIAAVAALVYVTKHEPSTETITGTVRYNERIALLPGSVLSVELLDVTTAEAPATVSRYEYTTVGDNVPLPFVLTYDSSELSESSQYSLFAKIESEGKTLFITATNYPITMDRVSGGIDMLLVAAPDEGGSVAVPDMPVATDGKKPPSPSPLAGTSWIWRETMYGDKRTVPDSNAFVISFGETEVHSMTDCNSLGGSYIVADSNITFSPFAMTEMYCEGSLDAVYAAELAKAIQFKIEGTALSIDIGARGQMRFMATEPVAADAVSYDNLDVPVSSELQDPVGSDTNAGGGIDSIDAE